MGNGAGVQVAQFEKLNSADISKFDNIEKRCKRGFYNNHPDEFRQDIKDAIKLSRIDILEVLLTNGSVAQEVYPLHLAATCGSMDSLELLISAGYSATSLDSHSRTPLHCCAQCRSPESGACADYLAFQNKKAVVMRDVEGCTPLATAVARQNVAVVAALMQHGPKAVTIADKRGRSAMSIATELQNQQIIELLGGKKLAAPVVKKSKEQQQIDEARIMQVWEKFFENCFLSMEAEANQDAGLMYDRASVEHIAKQQQRNLQSGGTDKAGKKADFGKDYGISEELHCELSGHILAWFDWILCTNQTEADGEEYYVINTHTYYSKWLSDLVVEYSYAIKKRKSDLKLESFGSAKSGKCGQINAEELEYPFSAEELFQQGWIAYFDVEANEVYWMQLATGRCEKYLPVGDDFENVVNLGLDFYEGDTQWVRPNQYPCAQSWVCVPVAAQEDVASFYVEPPPPFDEKDEKKEYEPSWVAEKKSNAKDSEYSDKAYDGGKYEYDPNADNNGYVWNNEAQEWVYQYPQQSQEETYNDYYNSEAEAPMNNYYFFNTFSGQSVWFEPVGWQELIMSEWNGWWLCREELTGIEYWWNPDTDESQLM